MTQWFAKGWDHYAIKYTLVDDDTGDAIYLFGHILAHGFQMYLRTDPEDGWEHILHEGQSKDVLICDKEV